MFEELAKKQPDHFAVRQYAKYKLAAGKTAKSIPLCSSILPHSITKLPFGSVTTNEQGYFPESHCIKFGLTKNRDLPLPEPPTLSGSAPRCWPSWPLLRSWLKSRLWIRKNARKGSDDINLLGKSWARTTEKPPQTPRPSAAA